MERAGDLKITNPATTTPIFILGIGMRSGTNYLMNLLCLHPDCEFGGVIWEDFITEHADLLIKYVDSVSSHWEPDLDNGETVALKELLTKCLGNGLGRFLNSQSNGKESLKLHRNTRPHPHFSKPPSKRLVSKTPSVINLKHFFKLFPDAHLLIVIRDGRSVVESTIKWLDLNDSNPIARWLKRFKYEEEMRKWTMAANTILQFCENNSSSNYRYLVVKYEDMWNNLENELCRILAFLNLDEAIYEFEAAAKLPVRGSSVLRGNQKEVHWEPVNKTPDFNPISRWNDWTRALHERFNWVAGNYLLKLGYEKKQFAANRMFWTLLNLLLDIWWFTMGSLLSKINQSAPFKGLKANLRAILKKNQWV